MSEVRVRFAPSPTGFFHIGSARTALFNWLYARHTEGRFILRIEDTDAARNTDEALQVLLEGMRWLGMDWDEGPEVGGEYGPYFQSQRGDIYKEYLARLEAAGRTYERDGAVFFRLEGERYTEFDQYHGKEIEKVRAEAVEIDDAIRGKVVRAEDKDFVIFRSDGSPTFHFVNVVDDITMKITHVIRGEDHLSNTSKHVELFKAFGVESPQFAHLPLILKDPKMGKGKMSKRDKGSLIEEYQQRHFLPAAVRNAIALLGWNPGDDREIMSIGEIIEAFDIKDIQKGAARFDEAKMAHLNFQYLKELPVESYAWFARPVLTSKGLIKDDHSEDHLQRVLALCQEKITSLEALPEFCGYFFSDDYPVNEKTAAKVTGKGNPAELAAQVIEALEPVGADKWTVESIEAAFSALATAHGQEKPFMWWPLTRFAVSGLGSGPDFLPMLEVMGKDLVLRRLNSFATGL
ncbi:MAG: glutamate--tRNA ligase [Opitutales bacterium]|jgi:glutamyl-tRNA synthetase